MSSFPVVAAVLLMVPTPVLAQIVFEDPPPKVAPTKASNLKSDWDKIECRAEDVLGSRLERHLVCLTKWQWWANEQETKQRVREWERLGSSSN
jgi:hypothetical protein